MEDKDDKIKAAIKRLNSFLADDSGYDKEVYPLLHKRLEENESVSPNYEELEAKCWRLEYEIEEMQMVIRSAMDVLKVVAGEKKEA